VSLSKPPIILSLSKDKLRPFDRLTMHRPFDKLRANGLRVTPR
jgi:hypothetical protein